ncbi:MAG: hypothetical protein NVSMB51_05090 [Solirubrobacteraceae bacterium]
MTTSRADLHCHSSASEVSKLGVQRALGLPECATPPEEVYALAKRRGMDFVTITDHDTIDGVMTIAERPDVFVSEELTTWFRGEPQAAHVLCLGITPDDHAWLQAHARDLEACAEYLHGNEIACALAHPFYAVAAPLTSRHRRRLAELFPVWETRNGARAPELNMPAAVYVETNGGAAVGGSDDHAGVDIGRTFTSAPAAATPAEFLEHVRSGRGAPGGEEGSAAKWAHAAIALAIRAVGSECHEPVAPRKVLSIAERVLSEGDARQGSTSTDLSPSDTRSLLRAWLDSVGLDGDPITMMQADGFSHADLYRRARRRHERRLRGVADSAVAAAGQGKLQALADDLFSAALPAIPYGPATAFIAQERIKLGRGRPDRPRVAIVADGIGAMHGVTRTLEEIRERGVPGYEVEVLGTDANVDRRLPSVAEIEVPHYEGLTLGVPSLPGVVEALTERSYDLVHVCAPGPTGATAALLARLCGIPLTGSYHTELGAYAGLRSGDQMLQFLVQGALAAFYGHCRVVLSPSSASDGVLAGLGIEPARIMRWDRGVDTTRFDPSRRTRGLMPSELINVLYAGRITREKGADLLADAFEAARRQDGRLHLVLAGGGPEEDRLRERLGEHATFLGWLDAEQLPRAYASADMFLFASETDTFGQVVLEAQASGLPVIAVDAGGPRDLIDDGVSGLLRAPRADALAAAVLALADSPVLRGRLARGGQRSVAERSWPRALSQLAGGYAAALLAGPEAAVSRAA